MLQANNCQLSSIILQASESHERDEELKKKIDILQIRANKSEDSILTLLSQNTRIESHIRIALKDVQTVQTEVAQFKEKIETLLKDETDSISQKWAQVRLSVKQITDLINDLQKQQNFSQDDINRHTGILSSHQEYLEGLNRRITRTEQIKLDENIFNENHKAIDLRIKDIKNQVIDVQNNLKSTDNYLEKYLPFNTFGQLFEVLRLTLEASQINKVKDYEEYRLKELYDIILLDQGEAKTTFNKKYIINPVGYELDSLAKNDAKLQSKSKRFIMGRPSLSSSVKLNEKGEPIIEAPKNSFYGLGARLQKKSKKEQKTNKSLELPLNALTLSRTSQSMKEPRPSREIIKGDLKNIPLGSLLEDPKGEDQSQISFQAEFEDDDEEEIDEKMNDAIEDLLANMHEDNSSLGIKNLDYLKKKLFDPEIEIFQTKLDTKIKQMDQEFEEERKKFKIDYEILDRSKNSAIEAFSFEIDGFNKIIREYQQDMRNGLQKFQIQFDKLQNMYNYLSMKMENQRSKSNSQPHQSNLHMNLRNSLTENKSRNANTSALITDYGTKTNLTNSSMRHPVDSFNNMTTALDHIKSFNHQTLFIKGGSKPILSEQSMNNTFTKEDLFPHQSQFNQKQQNIGEIRPRTAFNRAHSSTKTQKRMIMIPPNKDLQNQQNIIKINNAATSTYMKDASQQNSLIL
eukprot:403340298